MLVSGTPELPNSHTFVHCAPRFITTTHQPQTPCPPPLLGSRAGRGEQRANRAAHTKPAARAAGHHGDLTAVASPPDAACMLKGPRAARGSRAAAPTSHRERACAAWKRWVCAVCRQRVCAAAAPVVVAAKQRCWHALLARRLRAQTALCGYHHHGLLLHTPALARSRRRRPCLMPCAPPPAPLPTRTHATRSRRNRTHSMSAWSAWARARTAWCSRRETRARARSWR
jgi:hypothetical protein